MSLTLADGQLAAASATLLGADSKGEDRTVNVMLANTHSSSAETVILTVLRPDSTARRVARVVLSANETCLVANLPLSAADILAGYATDATTVDYTVTRGGSGPLSVTCLDANGAVRSGSGGLSGAVTLSSDLTLTNSGGVSYEAWDASDVETLWANAPSMLEPDFHARCTLLFDDFIAAATTAISDVMAWVVLSDGGTGTPVYQDAANGVFNVVTAAADNDYSAYSSVNESWLFASGKKLWFEARFKISEATTNESTWWFGLTDTLTTGGMQANAAGPLASYDGALIWKTPETALTVNFETSNAGTQATLAEFATSISNTWHRVGFYFDGTATTSTITPYFHNGTSWTAGAAQNITLAGLEEMHVVFGVKAGPTAAAETLQVDYVRILQLR